MMNALRLALAAALLLASASEAAAACSIKKLVGSYEVQITRIDHHLDETTFGTCWFSISRKTRHLGRLRIRCDDAGRFYAVFGLSDAYETAPQHRLVRVVPARSGIPRGVRPLDPCRWLITDRNGAEGIDYSVTFASDGQSLIGVTNAYSWLARAELTFLLNGVRQ